MVENIDVGMQCIKYMLFVSNFMLMMIGFLLISIGSTIKAIYGDFDLFVEAHYFSPAALAVAIGVIMFFVALFGCIGGFKESTCLVNFFSFLLIIIMILEFSASIAAYAMRSNIENSVRYRMEQSLFVYYDDSAKLDTEIWDFTQERLHCCGVDNSSDWIQVFPTTSTSPIVNGTEAPMQSTTEETGAWLGPRSCCRHTNNVQCKNDGIWTKGCLNKLSYLVSECALLLGCGALAVTFIQVLAIIFARMLAKAIRRIKTQGLVEIDQNRQNIYEELARGGNGKVTPVLYSAGFSEC